MNEIGARGLLLTLAYRKGSIRDTVGFEKRLYDRIDLLTEVSQW
jgi:hypothetical protein